MRNLFAALAVAALSIACPKPDGAPLPEPKPVGPTSQPSTDPLPSGAVGTNEHAGHEGHAMATVDRETVDADGIVRRGAALTPDLELTPVSIAVAKAKELDGKKVKLSGKVESVCQPQGCWFVVQGDKPEDKVRITTKAHNIFVPKSAVGMSAVVEGVITIKILEQKTAQHYEDERELKAGETRKVFTGDVTELGIDVTGLEMKKS